MLRFERLGYQRPNDALGEHFVLPKRRVHQRQVAQCLDSSGILVLLDDSPGLVNGELHLPHAQYGGQDVAIRDQGSKDSLIPHGRVNARVIWDSVLANEIQIQHRPGFVAPCIPGDASPQANP